MNDVDLPDPDVVGARVYCDRCGDELAAGGHEACRAARELEPPRYCPQCRRRMQVQVTPRNWTARCSVHGAMH